MGLGLRYIIFFCQTISSLELFELNRGDHKNSLNWLSCDGDNDDNVLSNGDVVIQARKFNRYSMFKNINDKFASRQL